MADVINLRMARKARVRAAKQSDAAANRAAFGRTKAERTASAAIESAHNHTLDGAKRDL